MEESPEEIEDLIGHSTDGSGKDSWIRLAVEQEKRVLVNAARIAVVRAGPRGGVGSFLTFRAGGQLMVSESPEEVLRVIGVQRLHNTKG